MQLLECDLNYYMRPCVRAALNHIRDAIRDALQ